ncbi:MAG: DUF551 domain-containing protein [Clostridiales bacterium]|nr:DUF551 domain-containing protein [Clostridiales bacterium]
MTKLEHAIKHIKTRADAWAVKEVTEALQSISERLDKALSQEPCTDAVSRAKAIENVVQIAKTFANSDKQKALCGRIIFMLEHMSEVSEMITEEYYKPCSLCHNADCVWMGGKDTHKLCEDFQALSQEPTDENLHREREQAYMQGYEDASKRFRQEPCDDAISREAVLKLKHHKPEYGDMIYAFDVEQLPSVTQKSGKWIPVSERLPEDLEPVNITWVNHEPEPYYHDIKDRNFVATGIYYRGQWYWYSTTCADYLGEYGSNEIDKVDDAVEIIAWMPLPKSYEPQESEE